MANVLRIVGSNDEPTMTTKEVADVLGVSEQSVRNNTRKFLPNKQMEERKATLYTEAEVAVLLDGMKHSEYVQEQFSESAKAGFADVSTNRDVDVQVAKAISSIDFERLVDDSQGSRKFSAMLREISDRYINALESRNASLSLELDRSKDYASCKRIEKLNGMKGTKGDSISWRELRRYSREHGYAVKQVFDRNYGHVNAYHRKVWQDVYGKVYDLPWEE